MAQTKIQLMGSASLLKLVRQGYTVDPTGVQPSTEALAELDATHDVCFLPAGIYRVDDDLDLSSHWTFAPGAILVPDNLVNIAVNGSFEAGMHQCFDLAEGGSVVFGVGLGPVQCEWFGAAGDGVTDCRAAIQGANDAVAAVGGTLRLGDGTFSVTRIDSETAYCVFISSNVTIEGAGREQTTIRLADNQLNYTRIFGIISEENVTVRSLTLDGNKAAGPTSGVLDQMHCVYLDDCTNVLFEDVDFADSAGDGLFVGYPTGASTNVRVLNCHFRGNERSGISLIACDQVLIQGCHFASDIEASPIDGEPSSTLFNVTNVRIQGNHFEGNGQFAIAAAGYVDHLDPSEGWVITGNFINGPVIISDCSRGIFANNILVLTQAQTQAIEIGYDTQDWIIANNYIDARAGGYGIYCFFTGSYYTDRLKIINNTILAHRAAIRCDGADNVEIRGNFLKLHTLATDPCISIQATRSMLNLRITDNTFVNGISHIQLSRSSTNTITGLILQNNTFGPDDSNPGTLAYNVNIVPSSVWLPGLVMGGDVVNTPGATSAYRMQSSYWSLGGMGYGGNQILAGFGSPEGVVTAGIGSIYLRRDGGVGTCQYTKESGAGNTGWVAK